MLDLDALPLPELFAALTGDGSLERLLAAAREEDLGEGDVTTESIVPAGRRGEGALVAREAGVVAGLAAVEPLRLAFGADLGIDLVLADGAACRAGTTLARLRGALRDLLAIERTLINLVARLSGIATLTRRYVEAVAGTGAVICDTRKTTPGLRRLEKYAVRCGGGTLHRLGLYDAALYKDNHLAGIPPEDLGPALAAAIRSARKRDLRFVEVETDSLAQLEAVLALEPGLVDVVLLDNMRPEELRTAAALRAARAPGVRLEASGGITLETAAACAAAGVDRISVGALTHGARSLDLSLEVEPAASGLARTPTRPRIS